MSARGTAPTPCRSRALAAALVRRAPRGAVRAAEALAATAFNRLRHAARLWNGVFSAAPDFDAMFPDIPVQSASGRADPAWNAVCRRIAARAMAGAGPDPALGAHYAAPRAASPPPGLQAPVLTAEIGPFAFYRESP